MTHEVCFWKDPAWIGAVAGLLAAIAAIISLLYQKLQIRVAIKEKWVNDFRHDLAEVLECAMQVLLLSQKASRLVDKMRKKTATDNDYKTERELYQKFRDYDDRELALRYRLLLFLDVRKKLHNDLSDKLQSWVDHAQKWRETVFDGHKNEKEVERMMERGKEIQREIIEVGRAIIDDELGIE